MTALVGGAAVIASVTDAELNPRGLASPRSCYDCEGAARPGASGMRDRAMHDRHTDARLVGDSPSKDRSLAGGTLVKSSGRSGATGPPVVIPGHDSHARMANKGKSAEAGEDSLGARRTRAAEGTAGRGDERSGRSEPYGPGRGRRTTETGCAVAALCQGDRVTGMRGPTGRQLRCRFRSSATLSPAPTNDALTPVPNEVPTAKERTR